MTEPDEFSTSPPGRAGADFAAGLSLVSAMVIGVVPLLALACCIGGAWLLGSWHYGLSGRRSPGESLVTELQVGIVPLLAAFKTDKGSWPTTLEDLEGVPASLLVNAREGRFEYRLEGSEFRLIVPDVRVDGFKHEFSSADWAWHPED